MSKILIDEATMKLALEALDRTDSEPGSRAFEREKEAITALREALAEQPAQQEPVAMRMPKVGDEVICIEDDSLGTVAYLTAGGSPEIRFDDGSHGTYVLREFAELFRYTTPQPAQQEPVAFYRCNGCGHAYEQVHPTSCDCMEGSSFEQVNYYTSPPAQRKPLTDEEWQNIADTLGCFINRGQKDAIEAALGIKENT